MSLIVPKKEKNSLNFLDVDTIPRKISSYLTLLEADSLSRTDRRMYAIVHPLVRSQIDGISLSVLNGTVRFSLLPMENQRIDKIALAEITRSHKAREQVFSDDLLKIPTIYWAFSQKPWIGTINLQYFIKQLPVSLQRNLEFMRTILKENPQLMNALPPDWEESRGLVRHCFTEEGVFFWKHVGEKWKRDPALIVVAMKADAAGKMSLNRVLKDIDASLRSHPDIALAAAESHSTFFLDHPNQYIEFANFQDRLDIMQKLLEGDGNMLQKLSRCQCNKELVLVAVAKNGLSLQFADPSLQRDREVVAAALRNNGLSLQFADPSLQRDPEFMMLAVQSNPMAIEQIESEDRNPKMLEMLRTTKYNPRFLGKIPRSVCDQREIVIALVAQNIELMKSASLDLQKDENLALKIISSVSSETHINLVCMPDEWKKNRTIVLTLVKRGGGSNLHDVDPIFRADKEVVLEAAKRWDLALQWASPIFRADKEVVLEAVKRWGPALQWASPIFQDDKDVVLEAVSNKRGTVLKYASRLLRTDRDVVLAAVQKHGGELEFADESFRSDPEIVLSSLKTYRDGLKFAAPSLMSDRVFVLAAVRVRGEALRRVDTTLQADPEIVLAAIEQDPEALQYVDPTLLADKGIILFAVEKHGEKALEHVGAFWRADRDIVSAAVKKNGLALKYASPFLQRDEQIVLLAIQNDPKALQYASFALQNKFAPTA